MKRIIYFVLFILIFVLLGCVGNEKSERFEFESSDCFKLRTSKGNDLNLSLFFPEGISLIKWEDNILKVEGIVSEQCGKNITGSYNKRWDTIILSTNLKFNIKNFFETTFCDCPQKVIFRIKNLDKKEYTVELHQHNELIEKQIIKPSGEVTKGSVFCTHKEEKAQDICYLRAAASTLNESLCYSIKKCHIKNYCFSNLAFLKREEEICENISSCYELGTEKYRCISTVAYRKNNDSICDAIQDNGFKGSCIEDIAEKTNY